MSIQLEVEQGKNWFRYGECIQQHFATGIKDGETTFQLKSDDADVTVDLENMTQKSSALKKLARVRVVVTSGKDAYSWCGKEGKTDKYFTPSLVEVLEEAFSKKKARITRDSIVFDLKNMKIKRKKEADEELKRVECKGKPYDAKSKAVGGLTPVADNAGFTSDGKADGDARKDAKPAPKGKRKKSGDNQSGTAGEAGTEMKSVVIKGKAPVDSECPVAGRNHVFYEDDCVWDCMLNQTNIGSNNNKYYVIQLLKEDGAAQYTVWMRWGRVGFKGQTILTPCHDNLEFAKKTFCWKFQEKTGNRWDKRDNFQKKNGKYDLLKMDYGEDEPDAKKLKTEAKKINKKEVKPCTLEKKVQDLIELICDVKAMEAAVVEMQFDPKKSPLGKLTEQQIKAGYEALKRIDELINKKKMGKELEQACSDFYTRIPHNFGMRPPTIIRTQDEIRQKLDLLKALGDIQLALKLMEDEKEDGDSRRHPADSKYRALNCDITHMDPSHTHYKLIQKYLDTTHRAKYLDYTLELLDVFSVVKESETERFLDYGNRMLLWHGSLMTNWAGILGAGLKIAPPEAPVNGYMFGKGIYFADMAGMSANFCNPTRHSNIRILLLCEVSLGECNELKQGNYRADKLPKGKHCTKGMGCFAPAPKTRVSMEDGVVVPMGPGVKLPGDVDCYHNEYIVYNVAQVRMRYALRVRFNYK